MIDRALADKLADIAVRQIRAGNRFAHKRKEQIKKSEEMYLNEVPTDVPGRFNPAVPVMSGFIDTLKAQLNRPVRINLDKQEQADLKKSQKVQSMWERDSSRNGWRMKDLDGKHGAAFSGTAAFYTGAQGGESEKYRSIFYYIDHHHFYCEPKKGYDLETHRFLGEMNVWRSKSELDKGVESGIYDKENIGKLVSKTGVQEFNEAIFATDEGRYRPLELDSNENYVGDPLFCLTNHYLEHEGTRYYLFLDYNTGVWIRAEKLEDMFSAPEDLDHPLWPINSWHTHPDPKNYWNKAPADDVRPIAEAIRVVIKLALEGLKKRTRRKKAVDPEVFPDISEIEDDITEVVETNVLAEGKRIDQGVYEFVTEDSTAIILNLTAFLNSFLGEKTGVNSATEGQGKEQLATIYVGNIERTATRMNLYSEFVNWFWQGVGVRYFLGLKDHLTEGEFVKILGLMGYEWSELTDEDTHPIRDFDIRITGGAEDTETSIAKQRVKIEAINSLKPDELATINPKWRAEQKLRAGGIEDEELRIAQDLDVYGDRSVISDAAQAIQDILAGNIEKLKPNRKATEAFVEYIIDKADDLEDSITEDQYQKLNAYAYLHLDIVARNMARKVSRIKMMRAMGLLPTPGAPAGAPVRPLESRVPASEGTPALR